MLATFPSTPSTIRATLLQRYLGSALVMLLTDAFVTKLNPQLSDLHYSTYLGGPNWEEALGLVIDGAGNAYVAGMTNSPTGFPISPDAPQPTLTGICSGGGSGTRHCYDGFATKLTVDGALAWSTYLGGADDDQANGIAVDSAGNVYVVGSTESSRFPTTAGVFQPNKALSDDAFLVKIGNDSGPPPPSMAQLYLPLARR